MRQGAVAVGVCLLRLVLECIRIDGVESDAQLFRALAHAFGVADLVPGKMRRHARCDAAQLMNDRAILEFLVEVRRLTGQWEAREPRAAGAGTPARGGQLESRRAGFDGVYGDAAA